MIRLNSIKRVKVLWVEEGGNWTYHSLPESLVGNQMSGSIRFVLREDEGRDDNLEVVIQKKTTTLTFSRPIITEIPKRNILSRHLPPRTSYFSSLKEKKRSHTFIFRPPNNLKPDWHWKPRRIAVSVEGGRHLPFPGSG
jgi:hypothetical protein